MRCLAGSVGRACESGFQGHEFEPHVEGRVYLKKKKRLQPFQGVYSSVQYDTVVGQTAESKMLKCKAVTAMLGECVVLYEHRGDFWGIKRAFGTSDDQTETLKRNWSFLSENWHVLGVLEYDT